MEKREALSWQHHKGYLKRLIAVADIEFDGSSPSTHREFYRLRPVIRFGLIAYFTKDGHGRALVVRKLAVSKAWTIQLREPGIAITITEDKILFATKRDVMSLSLHDLYEHGTKDMKMTRITLLEDEDITDLAELGGVIAVQSITDEYRVLRIWKNGSWNDVRKMDRERSTTNTALAADDHSFLHACFGPGEHEKVLWVFRYSTDGELLDLEGHRLQGHRLHDDFQQHNYELTLRHTGKHWCVVAQNHSVDKRWCWILSNGLELVSNEIVCVWKGMMYEEHGMNISVISYVEEKGFGDSEELRWPGDDDLLDSLRFLSGTGQERMSDIVVDDSFMIISHNFHPMFRWFIFTFDDLPGEAIFEFSLDRGSWSPIPAHIARPEPGWARLG